MEDSVEEGKGCVLYKEKTPFHIRFGIQLTKIIHRMLLKFNTKKRFRMRKLFTTVDGIGRSGCSKVIAVLVRRNVVHTVEIAYYCDFRFTVCM